MAAVVRADIGPKIAVGPQDCFARPKGVLAMTPCGKLRSASYGRPAGRPPPVLRRRPLTVDRQPLRALLLTAATLLTACSLPPLRGKAQVGKDPYAVVAADGAGGGDLYAVVGAGNEVVRLTWTPVRESAPALSPEGGMLAFIRGPAAGQSGRASIWVINLLGGGERELALPDSVDETLRQVAWSSDGRTIYAETATGLWHWPAPPASAVAERVPPGERARADSALRVLLGSPVFASITSCDTAGSRFCVETRDGRRAPLAPGASAPARWGSDSLALIRNDKLEIRPLGGGAARVLRLEGDAASPISVTYFPGTVE